MHCVQKVMSIHKAFNIFFFLILLWATVRYVLKINSNTGFLDNVCLTTSVHTVRTFDTDYQ